MLERAGVTLVGDHVRHIAVGRVAQAEISAVGFQREDIDINICLLYTSPSPRD